VVVYEHYRANNFSAPEKTVMMSARKTLAAADDRFSRRAFALTKGVPIISLIFLRSTGDSNRKTEYPRPVIFFPDTRRYSLRSASNTITFDIKIATLFVGRA